MIVHPKKKLTVKRSLLTALTLAAVLSAILQAFIDPSTVNLACVCWILASSLSVLLYVGCSRNIISQPLSTFAIVGFCVTTQLGALLAQTTAWTPVDDSLYQPVQTFATLAAYQGIAILAHIAYCSVANNRARNIGRPGTLRSALAWAGVYETPPLGALWLMGCVGLVSFVVSTDQGVVGHIAEWFRFLTWAPFLSVVYARQTGTQYRRTGRNRIALVFFSSLIVVLAIGLNIRQIMFFGVATILLLFLLYGLRSDSPVRGRSIARLGIAALLILAASGPVSDLATAMAVARAQRGKVPAVEMIATTIEIWQRPYLIDEYRAWEKRTLSSSRYDESYIANPLLARFVETKFHDNALYFAGLLSESEKAEFDQFSLDSVIAVLPEPALELLSLDVSKERFPVTVGDELAYLVRGVPLGGFKTGSMLAQGEIVFGILFPLIYAVFCLALYAVLDLLTIHLVSAPAYICAVGMMNTWQLFIYGITADSFEGIVFLFVREVPQMIAIYCALLGLYKLTVGGSSSSAAAAPPVSDCS